MNNKLSILAIFLLASVLVVSGCVGQSGNGGGNATIEASTGRAVFSASDAAMDLENVNKVEVLIDKIEVKGESSTKTTVILEEDKVIDLIELKASGAQQLLADVELEAGKYNQIVMDVKSVTVTKASGEIEEAKLPSNKLRIISDFEVQANSTTATNIDFLLDKSLHTTGSGNAQANASGNARSKIILAPVLKVDSHMNANVDIQNNAAIGAQAVLVASSRTQTTIQQGMDVNGEIKAGFELPASVELNIGSSGNVVVGTGTGVNVGSGTGIGIGTGTVTQIEMSSNGFSPQQVTIKKGDKVDWVNIGTEDRWPASAVHPTHTVYPGSGIEKCGGPEENQIFDACGSVKQGQTYSFTFNEVGTWNYHDHLNPGLTGTIVVTE